MGSPQAPSGGAAEAQDAGAAKQQDFLPHRPSQFQRFVQASTGRLVRVFDAESFNGLLSDFQVANF